MRYRAQALRIRVSFNLLYQFECYKVEYKRFLMQNDNHHIFSQFDVHNQLVCIKCNLCSVLLIMVVPDHHLVSGIFIDKHDHVCLIHHFNYCYFFVQVLNFLFQTSRSTVILKDFEARISADCEILLCLVCSNALNFCLIFV